MKIGIVTVYDAANYGSYLQAFALSDILKQKGHSVYFIKNPYPDIPYKRQFFKYPINRRSILHPLKVLKEYFEGRKKYNIFKKALEKFDVIDSSETNQMDIIILGSDEIWNVTMECFKNPFFYGFEMNHVCTYAVSMGKASKKDYQKHPELISQIKKIDKILVRDENTKENVEDFVGRKIKTVCDPTLLLPVSNFHERLHDHYISNCKYILVYSYPVYISDTIKQNIIQFAKKNNLKIVSACFSMEWCDYMLNCSPLEFCDAIRRAEYVVTTTFHGSIFSFLNHKRFVSVPFSIKVSDILTKVGIPNSMATSECGYEEFEYKLKQELYDYSYVDKKVKEMRETGLRELDQVLKS